MLLAAQQRRSFAEAAYYRSLVDYNRAISQVHFVKGSLLEYNDIYLAEGPWPCKAYFDARRHARERDAGKYIDYGYTRPDVFSRGPIQQFADGTPGDEPLPKTQAAAESIATPKPTKRPTPPDPTARRTSSPCPMAGSRGPRTGQDRWITDRRSGGEMQSGGPASMRPAASVARQGPQPAPPPTDDDGSQFRIRPPSAATAPEIRAGRRTDDLGSLLATRRRDDQR